MDLPVVIEVIDSSDKISTALEFIYPMVREGLITLEDIQVIKYTHRLLNPLPVDRLVSEIMTRDVIALSPGMPVYQAWQQMLNKSIKAMPVVDADGKIIGILTDEDLLERAGLNQRLSVAIRMDASELKQQLVSLQNSTLAVTDVMTKPVTVIEDTANLGIATNRMVKSGLKRLPVVNKEGRLVGMLSRLDILRQVAQSTHPVTSSQLHAGAVRTVKDVMSTKIPMVNQDDDLATIIDKFSQTESHRLIVVDSNMQAIGLISDSDVVARVQPSKRRGILEAFQQIGKPPQGTETAYDLMSAGPLTASPDLSVVEATKLMLSKSRKWLVIVDEKNKPLGLVDRQILLEAAISLYQTE